MLFDVIIGFLLVGIIFRGREVGMVRQVCSALGFGLGFFMGAMLQPHVVNSADTTLSRALLSLMLIIGSAIFLASVGELVGVALKRQLQHLITLNKVDAVLGSVVGATSLLLGVWLLSPIIASLPDPGLQQELRQSGIVSRLNRTLPPAPKVLSSIDRLINPNGFPDVFMDLEREPTQPDAPLPSLGELQAAVQKTRPSVVKLEGRGCGGIVLGSGYVASQGTVVTNAHVIAGVDKPTVVDGAGRHAATPIWFDPDLDMAVLRVTGLTGPPLPANTARAEKSTAAVVVGYPAGHGFTATPATVLDQFSATGRNIYDQGTTKRSIYELKADVVQGNSGGPLIDKDGAVIGLIFAQSINYDQIGYALTMQPVVAGLNQAIASNEAVGTGQCAEG